MKVLVVEDEKYLAEAVEQILRQNNYGVDVAFDGEYGLDCALSGIYDVIILDIMLPKMDGLSALRAMRKAGIFTPVLLLTARGSIPDRVKGLDMGADDYLPKPFDYEELLARLRALGRRRGEFHPDGSISFKDIEVSPQILLLRCDSKEAKLTLKEAQLLELLLSGGRQTAVSKNAIIEKLWGYDADVGDSHVEGQVSLLRKKLRMVGSKTSIRSIRRMGYVLEVGGA